MGGKVQPDYIETYSLNIFWMKHFDFVERKWQQKKT